MENCRSEMIQQAISEDELVGQLKHLGIKQGMTLEVHTAFSKLGTVLGGPTALNNAIIKAVGQEGNIVMPCQDCFNTEPLFWENPPIDFKLMQKVRDNTPGYDIHSSGLHQMGVVVDEFRTRKGVYHSYHPSCGFVAYGKDSKTLMSFQPLSFPFGDKSPVAKMYETSDSYTLLIGCDYDKCTSWHYGEYLSGCRGIVLNGGSVKKDGQSIWKKYLDIELDSNEFIEIGQALEKSKLVRIGRLQDATCKLFKMKEAIDFVSEYLRRKYE